MENSKENGMPDHLTCLLRNQYALVRRADAGLTLPICGCVAKTGPSVLRVRGVCDAVMAFVTG